MFLEGKVNNVPVQLEVINVGPASIEDIDSFREKLNSGKLVLIDQSVQEPKKEPKEDAVESPESIKEDSVKEEPTICEVDVQPEKPVEDVQQVDIGPIIQAVHEIVPVKKVKAWYKSKTIITNSVGTFLFGAMAYLAEDPQLSSYLPAAALAVINLVLRAFTKGEVGMSDSKEDAQKELDNLKK